jgi:hypothetical protein
MLTAGGNMKMLLEVLHSQTIHRGMCGLLCAILLLFQATMVKAQSGGQPSDGVATVVVSINGSIAECSGGFVVDLADAEINSLFGDRTVADIVPGTRISVDGRYVASQSSPTRTVIKAATVEAELRKEMVIEAPIQQIDRARRTIVVFGRELLTDNNTKLFRKINKKKKKITFDDLNVGTEVTVEAEMLPQGLTARKVVKLLDTAFTAGSIAGIVTAVNGNVIDFVGDFKVDISVANFPVEPDFFAFASIIQPLTARDTLRAFGFGIRDRTIFFNGNLDGVDTSSQTITVFGRKFTVTNDTQIWVKGKESTLSKLEANKPVFVTLQTNATGIIAFTISQD